MVWALKIGQKCKCNTEQMGILASSSLFYVFFQYLNNLKNHDLNKLLIWAKPLVPLYRKYSKFLSDEEVYNVYMWYAPPIITPISVNDFLNLVEMSDCWPE